MSVFRRMRIAGSALAVLLLGGCPPAPPPPEPVVERTRPGTQALADPSVHVSTKAGDIALPWAPAGARAEAWRVDLFDVATPHLAQWLTGWTPTPMTARATVNMPDARVLPAAEPGAYLVRLASASRVTTGLVLASTLRVALVLGDLDFEVFCVDTTTGKPVENAFVKVAYETQWLGQPRVLVASGTTRADGRWHSPVVRDEFAPSIVATAVAGRDDHFALATAHRSFDHSEADWNVLLRARSPSFQPGQRADFTGAIQRRADGHLSAMANVPLRLDLVGANDSVIATTTVRTDAVGAFTSAFELPRNAPPGACSAILTLEKRARFEPLRVPLLHIEPLIPAPFRVRLDLSTGIVQPGADLQVTVSAHDAENRPLPDARVRFVSWGYPVAASGTPPWAQGKQPVDPSRVRVLPIALPRGVTGADGTYATRWNSASAELSSHDLLCGLQAEVALPQFGAVARTAEVLLLHDPPPVTLSLPKVFYAPSEPITASFLGALPPQEGPPLEVTCTLTHEDGNGSADAQVLAVPADALASRRLVLRASRPGRYVLRAQSRGLPSEAVFWVVDGTGDVHWSGAEAPLLVPERDWLRRGESLRAIAAAPPGGPLALTFHSGYAARRETLDLATGARALMLQAPDDTASQLDVTLVQMTADGPRMGHAALGVAPSNQSLDVQLSLLYVRTGDTPRRGYGIATTDLTGQPVLTIVGPELIRPSFVGTPPVAVRHRTLHWHDGRATSASGAMEVAYNPALLAKAYGLFIKAIAPDGRIGTYMMPTQDPAPSPSGAQPQVLSPADKFAAVTAGGFASPVERWLASLLLERHPTLAERLPELASTVSAADAPVLIALASQYPDAQRAVLRSLATRRDGAALAALQAAAPHAVLLRATFEQALATHPLPAVRAASAKALGAALPASRGALAAALATDTSAGVREAAAHALGSGDAAEVAGLAEAAAREQEPTVLLVITGSLGRLGGVDAARALINLACRREPDLAGPAVHALDTIGYRGSDPRLRRVLRSGPLTARAGVARLLLRSGLPEDRAAVLAAAKANPTGPLVAELKDVQGGDIDELVLRWLKHVDPAVRLAAAERLLAPSPALARSVLRDLVDLRQPPEVADRAALLLIGNRDDAAVPKIVALADAGRLTDQTTDALIRTAGELGWQEAGRFLVAVLWRGLADSARLSDAAGRERWLAALRAAARVGPIWNATVERAIGDASPEGLYAPALEALRQNGFEAFLRALWYSPLPDELRQEAVSAYARLQDRHAADELLKLLESPSLQAPAARALARLGAVDPLLGMCRHPLARVRAAAAAALGDAGQKRAVPQLQDMLKDTSPFPRLQAAWALANLTGQPVLYTDPSGEPRQATPRAAQP